MTSVLVTGGAGYVGSHSCKALAAAGLVPVTYDNVSRGHREAVKWGPFELGDIRDSFGSSEAVGFGTSMMTLKDGEIQTAKFTDQRPLQGVRCRRSARCARLRRARHHRHAAADTARLL